MKSKYIIGIIGLTSLILKSKKYIALTPYKGTYDLRTETKMGNLKIGTAVLNLEIRNDQFEFTTEAKTESLWKALYDYFRSEKSIGNIIDGHIIISNFSVIEKIKSEVKKNYKLTIIDRNYVNSSTGKKWTIEPGNLVDQLSVYLALSIDIQKNPDQVEFIYQVAEEDGVEYQTFLVEGYQTVTIEDNEIETIVINCPELELTLNLSIRDNLQPVKIHKINGKTAFTMILVGFD